MPTYHKPEDLRLDDVKPYNELEVADQFEHETFQLERPPRIATISEGTHVAEVLKLHKTRQPNYEDPSIMEDKVVVLLGLDQGTIQKTMNYKFHPKSTLGQFLEALLGEIPTSINSDDLVHKQLRVTVIHKEKDGDSFANITAFKKMK
jgi:hypothetical protein